MLKRAGETDLGILEEHENSLLPHLVETLPLLLKGGNLLHIPLTGWTQALTGSGTTSEELFLLNVLTGVTANSTARRYTSAIRGFNPSNSYWYRLDWGKKLYLMFSYGRGASDAEAVGRLQIKDVTTEGALAAKGIGIKALNFALWGESYGTQLGEVDLGVTLAGNYPQLVVILHDPSVPKIEWYVDGVLKGTQNTAAKIPSGTQDDPVVVHSIKNGATGGVSATAQLMQPKLWQAR